MPTYEYACKKCGDHLEVVQSFKDDPLTTCPKCGGDLRKVFGSIGVTFKGSGFYKTDSRPRPKDGGSDPKRSEPKSDSKSSESKSSESKGSTGSSESKSSSGSGSSGARAAAS
jgi:putative FmdB family regulatory protein